MLPSLLAHDIQTALKHYLVSAFEPADAFNHGLMGRFVDGEEAWLKDCPTQATSTIVGV